MKLDSSFTVNAPIEEVWKTLMDFEQVAGCVPGAQVLNRLSDDVYQVAMKVKLGPVTMQYKGQMEVLEQDSTAHRAVLKGSAKEARGQGTAQATAHLSLVESGHVTTGTVAAEVALSGKAAAMGQSVIGTVTDSMMAQFANNLQVMLAGQGAAVPSLDEGPDPLAAAQDVPVFLAATQAAAATQAPADSLDGIAVARSLVLAQLQDPQRLGTVLTVVAALGYLLGKRSGRREARRWGVVPLR